MCDFLAAALIFHAVFSSKNKRFRSLFILAGLAILFWASADTLWFIIANLLDADPNASIVVNVLYFGTSVCLVAAMLLYSYLRLRTWNTIQLIMDGAVFSLSILWLIWTLMYQRSFDRVERVLNYGIMNSLNIGMDVFLIVMIGIWYLSIHKGRLPVFLRVLISGVIAFAAVNLIYYHLYANNLYVPDSLIDIAYLATLTSIAIAVKLYYIQFPAVYTGANPNTSIGNTHKGLLLLICPAWIYLTGTLSAADIALLFRDHPVSRRRKQLYPEIDSQPGTPEQGD